MYLPADIGNEFTTDAPAPDEYDIAGYRGSVSSHLGVVTQTFLTRYNDGQSTDYVGIAALLGVSTPESKELNWTIVLNDHKRFGTSGGDASANPYASGRTDGFRTQSFVFPSHSSPFEESEADPLSMFVSGVDYINRFPTSARDGTFWIVALSRPDARSSWTPPEHVSVTDPNIASGFLAARWVDVLELANGGPVDGTETDLAATIDHIQSAITLAYREPATGRKGLQVILAVGDV